MNYKLEEVYVPLIEIESVGGEKDYVEGVPQIRIKGYKNRDEIKLIVTTEIEIRLFGLPQELQDLWYDFREKVEDWVKEQEEAELKGAD